MASNRFIRQKNPPFVFRDFAVGDKEIQTYFKLLFKVSIRNKLTKNYSVLAASTMALRDSHHHTG